MYFELQDENTPEITFLLLSNGWILNYFPNLGVENLLFLFTKSPNLFLE